MNVLLRRDSNSLQSTYLRTFLEDVLPRNKGGGTEKERVVETDARSGVGEGGAHRQHDATSERKEEKRTRTPNLAPPSDACALVVSGKEPAPTYPVPSLNMVWPWASD